MRSKLATAGFVVLALGVAACGGERTSTASALQTNSDAVLTVHNDHWLDVTVYALSGGTRHRLGTVTGLKTESLPVRNTIVASAAPIRLLIEPIGSPRTHVTEPVTAGPADVIELLIRDPLNLTTFTVTRRASD